MDKSHLLRRIFSVLVLVVFLNLFIFHKIGGVAFFLWTFGFSLFLLMIYPPKEKKILTSFFFGILLSNLIIITHSSMISTVTSVLFVLVLFVILIYILSCQIRFVRGLIEIIFSPFILAVNYFFSGIHLLNSIFTTDSDLWKVVTPLKSKKLKDVMPWIFGFVIALPIVFILISSLSNADPIFSSYVSHITKWLSNIFKGDFWNRIFARVILTLFFLGFFSPFIFLKGQKDFKFPLNLLTRYPLPSIMTVVIGLIILTLGSFIIIQWPYIFVNVPYETDLSKFGVATYSEYVKRGFSELLKVSLFVYGLIWFGLIALRQMGEGKEKKNILFFLQLILSLIFIIFLISIGRRIMLYQNYHGWSLGRIYGGFILFWIVGMTLTLIFRNFIKIKWVLVEFIFTGLLIIIVTAFNAEGFITLSHPPTVNKRVDFVYLSRFSPDGYEGWVKAYDFIKKILLESGYDKLNYFNEDNRREIAYAGIITHILTRNYDYLISEYGSEEEQREYYKRINLLLRENLEEMSEYLKPQVVEVKTKQINDLKKEIVYPTKPPRPMNMLDYNQKEVEELKNLIDDNLFKLNNIKVSLYEVHNIYYISGWSNVINYNPDEQYIGYYGIMAPISFSHVLKPNFLDRLYMWNWSKKNAYQRMKIDIPHQDILKLQSRFYYLYKKISTQKDNERNYSSDLSFEGPFLQPL